MQAKSKVSEGTAKLVTLVKEEHQDFEWYPTTQEMVNVVGKQLLGKYKNSGCKMLDIGAGNGSFFDLLYTYFSKSTDPEKQPVVRKYAIEKSDILINAMPEGIVLLGTDFHEQTLIDKKMDVIFCNPPYSEYEQWMEKILLEAYASELFFIVPQRWKESKRIEKAIERKEYTVDTIYSGDFLDSEFRKARAKIDIVIVRNKSEYYTRIDPFDIWFEDHFKIDADKTEQYHYLHNRQEKLKEKVELIEGRNLIERLVVLYQDEFQKLLGTYKKLEELDYALLKELNVNVRDVKIALKEKISGLKTLYWQELFENLDRITDRLTKKSREKIRGTIMENASVDFTSKNAYAIVLWVLKNANIYIDDQLKDVYFEMASKDNIVNYKSNKKFYEGGWRSSLKDHSHFKLDYRLVFSGHSAINEGYYEQYDYPKGLYRDRHDFLNDICTIAKNLGINVMDTSYNFKWRAGEEVEFLTQDCKTFMAVRAFKNGNLHCKPSKEFIQKLNIEMARLMGWIHSKDEAVQELGMTEQEVNVAYGSNIKLLASDIKLLEVL